VKLLLDEHYSPAIAEQLQERGYDVIPVAERSGAAHAHLRQRSDEELLHWARHDGRVLVTENVRDFMPLHQAFLARGDVHAGILFTSPGKFPRRTAAVGSLITALAAFLDRRPAEAMAGDTAWL
jgi:predicted nuclease of predicted toxin-antitoxin system